MRPPPCDDAIGMSHVGNHAVKLLLGKGGIFTHGTGALSPIASSSGSPCRAFKALTTVVLVRADHADTALHNHGSMGMINRLFGEQPDSPEENEPSTNLAFVLLSEPQAPDAEAISMAFRDFADAGEELRQESDDKAEANNQIVSLNFSTGERSFVALMPIAVPNGEADEGAQFSLCRFQDGWELPPHNAHLLVSFNSAPDASPLVSLSRFTSLLAAVTRTSPAVGVYWGNAGATHGSEFFVSVASAESVATRMMLWSGMSLAREEDGRLSLLSLGMEQLNLPNLLLVAGAESEADSIETMYDLLYYVAKRGEALPEGDTVGRTDGDRLPVHYVSSPVDSKKKVWKVELP